MAEAVGGGVAAVVVAEFENGHGGEPQIECAPCLGRWNMEHVGEPDDAEARVGEEGNALLVRLQNLVARTFTFIAEAAEEIVGCIDDPLVACAGVDIFEEFVIHPIVAEGEHVGRHEFMVRTCADPAASAILPDG